MNILWNENKFSFFVVVVEKNAIIGLREKKKKRKEVGQIETECKYYKIIIIIEYFQVCFLFRVSLLFGFLNKIKKKGEFLFKY